MESRPFSPTLTARPDPGIWGDDVDWDNEPTPPLVLADFPISSAAGSGSGGASSSSPVTAMPDTAQKTEATAEGCFFSIAKASSPYVPIAHLVGLPSAADESILEKLKTDLLAKTETKKVVIEPPVIIDPNLKALPKVLPSFHLSRHLDEIAIYVISELKSHLPPDTIKAFRGSYNTCKKLEGKMGCVLELIQTMQQIEAKAPLENVAHAARATLQETADLSDKPVEWLPAAPDPYKEALKAAQIAAWKALFGDAFIRQIPNTTCLAGRAIVLQEFGLMKQTCDAWKDPTHHIIPSPHSITLFGYGLVPFDLLGNLQQAEQARRVEVSNAIVAVLKREEAAEVKEIPYIGVEMTHLFRESGDLFSPTIPSNETTLTLQQLMGQRGYIITRV